MTVWQRKHNGPYSAAAEGPGRLTLPGKWGQISLSCFQILRVFRAGASSFGNGMHALLITAFASGEDRGRSLAAGRDGFRARHRRRVHGARAGRTYSDSH